MSITPEALGFLRPFGRNPGLPLLVYLPGMDGSGTLFKWQAQQLQATFDIRCLTIPVNDRHDWSGLTRVVARLLIQEQKQACSQDEVRRTRRPVYLCGESFGACLAIQLALAIPEQLCRLILVNPASSYRYQPFSSLSSTFVRWLPDYVYQFSTQPFLGFLAAKERISSTNQTALLAAMQAIPTETVAWRLNLLSQFNTAQLPLTQIEQPTLMIVGQRDRLLPSYAEAAFLLRQLPKAKLHLLPYSGHACLLEEQVNLDQILAAEGFKRELQQVSAVSSKVA